MRFRCRICNSPTSDVVSVEPWDPRCSFHDFEPGDDMVDPPIPAEPWPPILPEPADVPALPQPHGEVASPSTE